MPDSRGLEPEIAPRSSVFDGARRHALSSHCSWQFFTMSVIESAKLDAISLILTICGRFFVVARALSCFRLWGCLVRQPRSPLGRVCTSRSKSVRNSRCTAASSISSTFRYCPACAYLTALCVSAGGLDSRASRVAVPYRYAFSFGGKADTQTRCTALSCQNRTVTLVVFSPLTSSDRVWLPMLCRDACRLAGLPRSSSSTLL